ncbi:cytochrome C oxidase subunit II [Paenibacillus antri]|uniref:Cytochrome aa3 subunit 2 n=1 Tax=Paenibacillus antri TaxID=2582848 RepID=A0A5R9G5W8_9BACL|nr:cytochrome c oxidase subunit II [Paenibacillus antri]TLS50439.1 cytochrome C oxidase subunit II [Paenibacillus antri]
MHIHRLEKIWLMFGFAMLVVFLVVLGIGAYAFGMGTPTSHHHSVDPSKVTETAPFDQPGIRHVEGSVYEANLIAYAFGYNPDKMEVPAGATVRFNVTSTDVVHGFQIPGTIVNFMVVPGEINHVEYTFDEPGEYLVLCNEYCGIGHEYMYTTIVVN